MKRLSLLPACLAVVLGAALCSPTSLAAPRLGSHDGYARLVFDLPRGASFNAAPGGAPEIRLNTRLPAEQGALASTDVTGFEVVDDGAGSVIRLHVAEGRKLKVFTLPAQQGAPNRLVADVGRQVQGTPVRAGSPAPTQPTAQPVAVSAPVKPAVASSSPAGTAAKAAARPRLQVVLDPGHGGVDSGMVGYVVEKETTLAVAQLVRQRLEARGVDVIMTRSRDTQLSTNKRADLEARSRLAKADSANAYVSIHVNAGPSSAQGIETYYFGQPLESRNRSLAVLENGGGSVGEQLTRSAANSAGNLLGDLLSQTKLAFSKQLAGKVQAGLVRATGAVNRGTQANIFYVIRNPTTPAILIEIGFGSHPVEGKKLASAVYRQHLADSIADSIADWLHAE